MAKRGRKRKNGGEGRNARDQIRDGYHQEQDSGPSPSTEPCPKISVFSRPFVSPQESPFSLKYFRPHAQTAPRGCATLTPAKRVMEMENSGDNNNMMASVDIEKVVDNILTPVQASPASSSRYPLQRHANTVPRRTSSRIASRVNRDNNVSVSLVETEDGFTPMTMDVPITEKFTSLLPPQIQSLEECNPAPPLECISITTDSFMPTVADPTTPIINTSEQSTSKDIEDRQEESAVNSNKKNGSLSRCISLNLSDRDNNVSVALVETEDGFTPMTMDVPITEKFTSLLPQIQSLEECNPAPPLECISITTDSFVPTVADPTTPIINTSEQSTSKDIEDRQEESAVNSNKKNGSLSRCISLNLSEMADLMDDGSSSPNEVDFPGLRHPLITVEGYKVKAEVAPTLSLILSKHGDIAANSSLLKTLQSRSSFLEFLCGIIEELRASAFTEVTLGELESMRAVIGDMERINLEVGWLGKRLDDIIEAKQIVKQSSSLKEARNKNQQVIEEARKELVAVTEKVRMAELALEALREEARLTQEKLAASEVEAANIRGTCLEAKEKVKRFYKRSLVEDLLSL